MNATECIKGRRSIRKYKKGCIDHSLLELSLQHLILLPGKTLGLLVTSQLKTLLFSIKLPMNSPQTITRILSDKFQH